MPETLRSEPSPKYLRCNWAAPVFLPKPTPWRTKNARASPARFRSRVFPGFFQADRQCLGPGNVASAAGHRGGEIIEYQAAARRAQCADGAKGPVDGAGIEIIRDAFPYKKGSQSPVEALSCQLLHQARLLEVQGDETNMERHAPENPFYNSLLDSLDARKVHFV